ncbi:MAG: hypothetical protein RLN87_03725 [Parasphingopyxis sp.]|uniref:hypothetical protein n=1 Tax=Parasphingopyxis sp. TaxID=1920299 RepID=UPI00262C0689|nr:hypothetical protein [uncultured Parasphingopyxis sp.]
MARIAEHCGRAYEGELVSSDDADADMARERLVMHVAECGEGEIRIPFHVGDDRSRTWVLTINGADSLTLKHDHRHEDGSEDAVTQYGGTTAEVGTATRQEFPADDFSKALFEREGLNVSVANTWAMEIHDETFAYELRRPESADGRFFRVEFDLSEEVETPPPVWGSDGAN